MACGGCWTRRGERERGGSAPAAEQRGRGGEVRGVEQSDGSENRNGEKIVRIGIVKKEGEK